jgi:protease-4
MMAERGACVAKRKRLRWILLVLGLLSLVMMLRTLFATPAIEDDSFVVVNVAPDYEVAPPGGVLNRFVDESQTLATLLNGLDQAADDERINGLVLRIPVLELGWSTLRELRNAVGDFANSGKPVVAYLDTSSVGGNKEYYLATAASTIYVAPAASPMFCGLSARYTFLGGLWENLYVGVQVEQIREYKGFGDAIGGREMTEPLREMANSILDDINGEFVGTIAAARGMSDDDVRAIIDSCPATAADFVESGLATGQRFFDEILVELGGEERAKTVAMSAYTRDSLGSLLATGGPKIAVIYANGTIVPGKAGPRGVAGTSIGSATLSKAFRKAGEDPDVRAVVFRVNSPGGSPLGSDHVWRAARQTAEKKPVIASFADVAASGGYYMAAGADRIVAQPTTLTGSIGVVSIRPNVAALYDRLDIGSETLGRGRYARILDTSRPMDEAERALIKEQMASTYRLFLDRVAVGRNMTAEEVDEVGGGRVWTGKQALERGLVDELGGLSDAIELAGREAGLAGDEKIQIVYLPERRSFLEELLPFPFGQLDATAGLPTPIRELIGVFTSQAPLDAGIYALSAAVFNVR